MSGPKVHLALNDDTRDIACRTRRSSRPLLIANWKEFVSNPSCMRPRCTACVRFMERLQAKNSLDAYMAEHFASDAGAEHG
jgi:hypothetical protein